MASKSICFEVLFPTCIEPIIRKEKTQLFSGVFPLLIFIVEQIYIFFLQKLQSLRTTVCILPLFPLFK